MTAIQANNLRRVAARLQRARADAAEHERQLQLEVGGIISSHRGSMRDWARAMEISAQYACDISHGRRKISDAMLARILSKAP